MKLYIKASADKQSGADQRIKTKALREFDQQLLDEALSALNKVYEYNYSQSSHDKVSRRLEMIMKKIRELKALEID